MIEILLFVSTLVLAILLYLQHLNYSNQISELVKAVIAKNHQEFIELKKSEIPVKDEPYQNPEISLNELPDKQFLNAIDRS